MQINRDCESIFDEYKLERPIGIDQVVEVRSGRDPYEVVVVYRDGHKIIYDSFFKTSRYIPSDIDLNNLPKPTLKAWALYFSKRLWRTMNIQGIKQYELAGLTGISERSISKYVNGESIPNSYHMHIIAKALDVTVNYLSDYESVYHI